MYDFVLVVKMLMVVPVVKYYIFTLYSAIDGPERHFILTVINAYYGYY